jgi:hypothetical protein
MNNSGKYYTWRGDEINVKGYNNIGFYSYSVPRIVEMPDWLHDAFQTAIYADGWQERDAHDRNKWIHLYDAVLCETVTFSEADDCISKMFVPEWLTARASNYMHLFMVTGRI